MRALPVLHEVSWGCCWPGSPVRWDHQQDSAITSGQARSQAVFSSRVVPLGWTMWLGKPMSWVLHHSWPDVVLGCAAQLDGTAGLNPCSDRAYGRASWLDRASGCVLQSGETTDCTPKLAGATGGALWSERPISVFSYWARLLSRLPGQEVPLAIDCS